MINLVIVIKKSEILEEKSLDLKQIKVYNLTIKVCLIKENLACPFLCTFLNESDEQNKSGQNCPLLFFH